MSVKILVIVIMGFFGSGKIMIICYLLKNNKGCCIVVLVNEFGEVGIDGDLLCFC